MRSILKTKVERDIRYALGRSLRQPRAGHAQPTVKNVLLDSRRPPKNNGKVLTGIQRTLQAISS
jgi:hypothetical protein